MAARRYEISLLVLKKIFHSFASLTREIFSTLAEKFRIFARPCNILSLYMYIYIYIYIFFFFSCGDLCPAKTSLWSGRKTRSQSRPAFRH